MSGPNVEFIRTADEVEESELTLSAKDLQSRVEGDVVVLDDGEEIVKISAEIQPHMARERLRNVAVTLLAVAEGLK